MKNRHGGDDGSPFSYPVKVGHISANPVTVHLEADARELEDLANIWQVLEVRSLKADLQIARWKKDGVRLKGRVEANIVQSCVVTLEPVESRIDEDFEQIFVPEGSKLARIVTNDAAEMVLDPEGPDLPEPFSGDTIDAGAAVTEFAALAIDPYPRKPGVEFADHLEGDADGKSARPNPFAALKDWKKD
ncbi:DUF177 domain-containing protein [Rhizobium puerariae]|uniref:DUF177 domain-containing protein n=1 Tax=Rhizobium puerariae TaxID=1585791 RepID=A0ABV6AKF4_9HYPH